MKRIDLAYACLTASAFVLFGLLISGSGLMNDQAQAEMVVNKNNMTTLTTEIRRDEEALFVLDSKTEKLLAYQYDPNRRQNMLIAVLDVAETVKAALGAEDAGGGRRSR